MKPKTSAVADNLFRRWLEDVKEEVGNIAGPDSNHPAPPREWFDSGTKPAVAASRLVNGRE